MDVSAPWSRGRIGSWNVDNDDYPVTTSVAVRNSAGDVVAIVVYGSRYVQDEGDIEARVSLIKAAPDLYAEHAEWASTFGAALVLALQGDYSAVDELARNLPLSITQSGPLIRSTALACARGETK